MSYAIYSTITGKIRGVSQGAASNVALNLRSREDFLLVEDGVDGDTHYILAGLAVAKEPFPRVQVHGYPGPAPAGGRRIVIEDIPVGSTALWPDGVITEENDGKLVCDLDYPGDYQFVLTHLHYLPGVYDVST